MASSTSRQIQWIPLQQHLVPRVDAAYQKNVLRRHREAIESALKQGHLKYLDQYLILCSQAMSENERQEPISDLQEVVRISLSGYSIQSIDDIAVLSCVKLRICNLGSCYLMDISAFYGCVNLLKLELSDNQICQLPPSDFWSSLSSLRVLYLHGNNISSCRALSRLNGCNNLHVLTLYNTPLSLLNNYRYHVVNSIMSLRALDHHVISDEEIIENLHLSGPFQLMSDHFRLQLYVPFGKAISYNDELKRVYRLLLSVDRVLAKHSPVIVVQRWVKGWLVRKALAKSSNPRIRSFINTKRSSLLFKQEGSKFPSVVGQQVTKTSFIQKVPLLKCHNNTTTHKKNKRQHLAPHPTPTSAYPTSHTPLPVETHVIGLDDSSSRMKYFMHLNLSQLQQTISDTQLSAPEEIAKVFRCTLKKALGKPKRKSQQMAKSNQDASTESNDKPSSLKHIVVGPNVNQESRCVVNDMSESTVLVTGQSAQILPHEQLPDLAASKNSVGESIRNAKVEILKTVAQVREPPKTVTKSNALCKDDLLLTRACNTMGLSVLRTVDDIDQKKLNDESMNKKMKLVSKVREDRIIRKAKIDNFYRNAKEKARDWKFVEDQKLNELRVKLEERRDADILQSLHSYHKALQSREIQLKDLSFARVFGHQNTMVISATSREDHKQLRATHAVKKKDVMKKTLVATHDHQEMVRSYMELRRKKLSEEGEKARNKLDSTLLMAASDRLMKSKRKIAHEVARKAAARLTIASTKEELRKGPHRPGESLLADQGPSLLITDSNDQKYDSSMLAGTHPKLSCPRVHHMSREAYGGTWQRGCRAITGVKGDQHFPLIASSSSSPLMYSMMQPHGSGVQRTSRVVEPVEVDSELSLSATNSSVCC